MQNELKKLRGMAAEYRDAIKSAAELAGVQAPLQAEADKLLAALSGLPPSALALPLKGDEGFDSRTLEKLKHLSLTRTKLELLPGCIARQRTQIEKLKQEIRTAVTVLMRNCRNLASGKMESGKVEMATALASHFEGDADLAKQAIASVTPKTGAEQWRDSFAFYTHDDDPADNAESAVELVEAYLAGRPCP